MTISIASNVSPTVLAGYVPGAKTSPQTAQNGVTSAVGGNGTNQPTSSSVTVTATDIQSNINGINALIQSEAGINWSKFGGISPDQIANSKNLAYESLQNAEGATIARAEHLGIQGVSFDFDPINVTAISSGNQSSASQSTVAAENPAALTALVTAPNPSSSVLSSAKPQLPVQSEGSDISINSASSNRAGFAVKSGVDAALNVLEALNNSASDANSNTGTGNQKINLHA